MRRVRVEGKRRQDLLVGRARRVEAALEVFDAQHRRLDLVGERRARPDPWPSAAHPPDATQPSRAARSSTCRAAAAAGVTVSASRASAPRPKNGA